MTYFGPIMTSVLYQTDTVCLSTLRHFTRNAFENNTIIHRDYLYVSKFDQRGGRVMSWYAEVFSFPCKNLIFSFQWTQLEALISQIYFGMKLYVFRTVPLSIVRSLFTVHLAMVCVIQVCRQLSNRTRMELQFHPGHVRKRSADHYLWSTSTVR